jgi:predicted dehydrogenase
LAAPLRVAVVGAGRMGANHARVLAGLPDVTLAGVLDSDRSLAAALASVHGCPVLGALDEVRAHADAAIVAVSSAAHAEIGTALLGAALPCLIEKPLAMTHAECRDLIAAAERAGVPLAVGHVERFNPAVTAAADFLAGDRILAIEGRRLNPGSARIQDSDVVIDLMVHDIDTVLYLLGASPAAVSAQGVAIARPDLADHATAILSFPDGAVASLTASRIAHVRVRALTILCSERTVALDYLAQSVTVTAGHGGKPVALPVVKGQSLERELAAFVSAVRAQRFDAGVGAEEALRDLSVVWAIQDRLAALLPAAG